MKRIFAFVILSIANCAVADEKQPAQEKVPAVTNERPMSSWMAQKIEYSKKILEAVT